jgi:regulator of chromosome condensation (RCC1) repeat-containing protein
MRGLLLVLLAATRGSVPGVPDSTRAMRADASAAAATLIDFETYPNGSPTCNVCPITNEYTTQGLEISWASHTCAIAATTSETYCWGLNTNGQLGNGTTTGSMTPVKVVP